MLNSISNLVLRNKTAGKIVIYPPRVYNSSFSPDSSTSDVIVRQDTNLETWALVQGQWLLLGTTNITIPPIPEGQERAYLITPKQPRLGVEEFLLNDTKNHYLQTIGTLSY